MFIEERHSAILAIIAEKGSITTGEIQSEFGVGYDSAKRDLRILEEKGLLRRTHGGAIPVGELAIGRPKAARIAKPSNPTHTALAKAAIRLIGKGETVFIASGAIGITIAKELPRDLASTVITNVVGVAEVLSEHADIRTIQIGGEIVGGMCSDGIAAEQIRRMRFDTAFITTDGISADFGLSVGNTATLPFWNALMKASKRVIGVYPSEILGTEVGMSIGEVRELACLVTDAENEKITPFEGLVKLSGVE